jgi:hypothetical protein
MLTKAKWKNRIIKSMQAVGTYQESFDDTIETLAGILERRDALENQFYASKEPMIVERTNARGHTNAEQNPMIRLLNDMNRDALTYWRDLGLTPKGLKAITDSSVIEKQEDPLDEVLKKLGR